LLTNIDTKIDASNGFQPEITNTTTQITNFADQQGLDTDTSTLVSTQRMNPYGETTLHDFLSRPHIIQHFTWTPSTPSYSVLNSWSFPSELFKIPSVAAKLNNFQYFRGSIKLALRINATRMHYGRLLLSFSPNYRNGAFVPLLTSGFVHHCSLPHIQVSATDATVSEFIVPFAIPLEYIDLISLQSPQYAALSEMGTVTLWVMNQLHSDADTSVNCSLFASFTDITLTGYNAQPLIVVPPISPVVKNVSIGTMSFTKFMLGNQLMEQSGNDQEQQQKSREGVVSGIAEKVASFASPWSSIPVIGPIATAIATGASALGGLAKSFGYSKPIDQKSNVFIQHRFPVLAHGSGIETAQTLGTFPDNKVSPSQEYIGSSSDDMQISRIISTAGFIGSFFIDSTHIPNQEVFSVNVTPIEHIFNPNTMMSDHTLLSFTSAAFEYWRGSLNYRLQFVCSSFHSVRVRVAWYPAGASLTHDENESTNLINCIVDSNTSTELKFNVPYLSSLPWLTVPIGNDIALLASTNGRIVVTIVNTLTYYQEPIPPIEVNVWVSAGPDFQFAMPTDYRLYVQETQALMEQSGVSTASSLDAMRNDTYEPFIPATLYVDNNLCHGEHVTHLKHLLQRCSAYLDYNLKLDEFYTFVPTSNAPNGSYTFIDWFNLIYKYARGGFGVRMIAPGNFSFLFQNRRVFNGTSSTIIQASGFAPIGVGSHFVPNCSNFIPEAIVPFYSQQYGIPIAKGGCRPFSFSGPALDITVMQRNGPSDSSAVLCPFVADDWEYGFMIGAPQLKTDVARWRFMNTS